MWILLQAEKGVLLQAEQADWLEDTDEEVDEQELKAHYMYMEKIQEVHTTDSTPSFDVEPLEKMGANLRGCRGLIDRLSENIVLDLIELEIELHNFTSEQRDLSR
ncbi:hypothetical protein Tco_1144145 [Tanacetum coccineum]